MKPPSPAAALLALLCLAPGPAAAQAPAPPPAFCLETGLHTAAIKALSVCPEKGWALTAGEDRTARLWALADGRLVQTFRPLPEAGSGGQLYAAALSPDGRQAALGGWERGPKGSLGLLAILDPISGALLRKVDPGGPVTHLAFSPDGSRLAVHLGGKPAIRVLATATWTLLKEDRDFGGETYRGAFAQDGRYAATSEDGQVRVYDPAFKLLKKRKVAIPSPFGLAFRPGGRELAVAYLGSPAVEVLQAADLALLDTPLPGKRNLGVVAWSQDGQTLFASGGDDVGTRPPNALRQWPNGGRGAPREETPISRTPVSGLCPLPDGGLVFATQDPSWGVLDASGASFLVPPRALHAGIAFHLARDAFRVDAKAQKASLPSRGAASPPQAFGWEPLGVAVDSGTRPPRTDRSPLRVDGWKDGSRPLLNGQALPLDEDDTARSLSLAWDDTFLLLGSDLALRAVDAKGRERWRTAVPGAVWAVGLSEDARLAAALLGDGTLRWYRASDGRLLVSLYTARDRSWVAWTPSGHYACSPGGEALVRWRTDHPGAAPEVAPEDRHRDRFLRPRLFPLLLDTLDEAEALRRLADKG